MRCRARTPGQNRHAGGPPRAGERTMKARRLTAIGLVAAAGLWIASGHLIPHQSAESRVAVRAGGVLTELKIKRGMWVKKGDVIAVLSDEAREAQVAQAQAVVTQKRTELEAKRALILSGTLPRLQLVDLEAQLKSAEAALAAAEAEHDRGVVRAPWSGVVQDVAVEVGQAAFSMAGREIASLVALDPMLAVVEVAERQLAGIKVGGIAEVRLVTGERAS